MPPRIPEEAVEAAYELLSVKEPEREDVRAALAAAFEALGMRAEEGHVSQGDEPLSPPSVLKRRLVSRWVPVSGEQTDR